MLHAAVATMPVLHIEAAEAIADNPDDTPSSFPLLATTHQTSNLPRYREDNGPEYVSYQGMRYQRNQHSADTKYKSAAAR